jgi:hypothetical protein
MGERTDDSKITPHLRFAIAATGSIVYLAAQAANLRLAGGSVSSVAEWVWLAAIAPAIALVVVASVARTLRVIAATTAAVMFPVSVKLMAGFAGEPAGVAAFDRFAAAPVAFLWDWPLALAFAGLVRRGEGRELVFGRSVVRWGILLVAVALYAPASTPEILLVLLLPASCLILAAVPRVRPVIAIRLALLIALLPLLLLSSYLWSDVSRRDAARSNLTMRAEVHRETLATVERYDSIGRISAVERPGVVAALRESEASVEQASSTFNATTADHPYHLLRFSASIALIVLVLLTSISPFRPVLPLRGASGPSAGKSVASFGDPKVE